MSDHLSAQDIERYRQRQMTPQELRALDAHITDCEACRKQLRNQKRAKSAVTALMADLQTASAEYAHLPYERLEAYVDEALTVTDRQAVEAHLQACQRCAAEVRDLRAFRAMMTTYPRKEYAPTPRQTVWERVLKRSGSFWRSLLHWVPLQVAGTAAVVALCVWLTARPLQTQAEELRRTNAALQRKQDSRVAQLMA